MLIGEQAAFFVNYSSSYKQLQLHIFISLSLFDLEQYEKNTLRNLLCAKRRVVAIFFLQSLSNSRPWARAFLAERILNKAKARIVELEVMSYNGALCRSFTQGQNVRHLSLPRQILFFILQGKAFVHCQFAHRKITPQSKTPELSHFSIRQHSVSQRLQSWQTCNKYAH